MSRIDANAVSREAESSPAERLAAAPMFAASLTFLFCLAGLLHLHETAELSRLWSMCGWGMCMLYPLFVVEAGWHWLQGSRRRKLHLLYCLVPPLRLGARDHATGTRIWFPGTGWTTVDTPLRQRLERSFGVPMIFIALMILPLMAMEHFWAERLAGSKSLSLFLHTATALIWVAFTFEFIVMVSIVDRKLKYCKEHWIDIAVILLPVVAFLRTARLGRLLRLQQIGKIQQLTKTVRIYRMRGLLMKAWRAVLVLEIVSRIVRSNPEKQLARLRQQFAEREAELMALRAQIEKLEAALATAAAQAPAVAVSTAAAAEAENAVRISA